MASHGALEEGLVRWLGASEAELRLEIDHRTCLVGKQDGGIRCVFELGVSSRDPGFATSLLLRLAALSGLRFPGALAIDPADGQCVLVRWVPCVGQESQDCAALLPLLEGMANQAEVWCDLLGHYRSRGQGQSRAIQSTVAGLPLGLSLRFSP
ncbi:hypothetical protein EKK97_09810 [Billgrantia tianxiuensis]|uniref:Type III secretion system chaperone n=1 Tax=Billgrantia tianxiuensis TaxID=2497861 RepID=A0A6I6SGQ3_9GAMM|nr:MULTISPECIES: hypothetical protein [Halomonas]MCE8032128.1 hypothetical protein [Halomonas sp. MCCC 1A11057]QHC49838.1 hypothetical protein EKK97_09810 [Halomonas tianxiuensis]